MRYNEKVQEFNTTIRQFPNNIIASIFWFWQKVLFEAEAGSEKAPEVNFE
jgi:LemA protein